MTQTDDMTPDTWKWKRLRNIAFSVEFWPLAWNFGVWKHDDYYGGKAGLDLGPVAFHIHYNALDGAIAALIGPHCEMDVAP